MAEEVCTSLYTEGASSTRPSGLADVGPREDAPVRRSTLYGLACSVYVNHMSSRKFATEKPRRIRATPMDGTTDFNVWYHVEVQSSSTVHEPRVANGKTAENCWNGFEMGDRFEEWDHWSTNAEVMEMRKGASYVS